MVYVGAGGQVTIRLTDHTTAANCKAARMLKARYFVASDSSYAGFEPVWGVFDMRTAQRDNPYPGAWSINDPIKMFPHDARDAAVMYALALIGKQGSG